MAEFWLSPGRLPSVPPPAPKARSNYPGLGYGDLKIITNDTVMTLVMQAAIALRNPPLYLSNKGDRSSKRAWRSCSGERTGQDGSCGWWGCCQIVITHLGLGRRGWPFIFVGLHKRDSVGGR